MATESNLVTLNDIDAQIAALAARLIEVALQSAAARDPEQMAFLERLQAGDRLGLSLVVTQPADAPSDIALDLALIRADGAPVARVLGLTARRAQTCPTH